MKFAVAVRAAVIARVQFVEVPALAQSSLPQPVKLTEVFVLTVSVTELLVAKLALQVEAVPALQLMPAGEEKTMAPLAVGLVTVTTNVEGTKFAVTLWAWLMSTEQVPLLLTQAPDQPLRMKLAPGDAVRTTVLLLLKAAVQVPPAPQLLIPGGFEATVPEPTEPEVAALSRKVIALKLAVTDCAWFIVTLQVAPVADGQLVQPMKLAFADGASVRTSAVFAV